MKKEFKAPEGPPHYQTDGLLVWVAPLKSSEWVGLRVLPKVMPSWYFEKKSYRLAHNGERFGKMHDTECLFRDFPYDGIALNDWLRVKLPACEVLTGEGKPAGAPPTADAEERSKAHPRNKPLCARPRARTPIVSTALKWSKREIACAYVFIALFQTRGETLHDLTRTIGARFTQYADPVQREKVREQIVAESCAEDVETLRQVLLEDTSPATAAKERNMKKAKLHDTLRKQLCIVDMEQTDVIDAILSYWSDEELEG